jgi:hypothetical protein
MAVGLAWSARQSYYVIAQGREALQPPDYATHLTVAGQRRTHTGFAFKPWRPSLGAP